MVREMTYPNGDVYYGAYKNDKRHGHGGMKYANGNYYNGEWKDDEISKFTNADGSIAYNGWWKDGKPVE